jgi:hypothetical protein
VLDEVRYIVDLAANRDSRVIGVGPLVFFSTASGDAWVLDPADERALCLARDGSAMRVHVEETAERFAIEWTHHYRIDGSAMVFSAADGKITVIEGYPSDEIRRTARQLGLG